MKNYRWRFLNKSVCGASHVRKAVPCQDYSLCVSGEEFELPIVITAADGHGGRKYFRSAQGAVFACETAVSVFCEYGAVFKDAEPNVIKQITETRIKMDIIKGWQAAVLEHAEDNPFSDDELEILALSRDEMDEGLASGEIADKERILAAYGTTLLVSMILDTAIICMQIGDGDILFYQKDGRTFSPIENDDSLLGNETTSLCSLKAPFYFRHSVTYLYEGSNVPHFIMLATDGYANSFTSRDDYLKTAKDYYDMIIAEGADFVSENIDAWLAETSVGGSGDDITVAAAWRA